jgi:hypothetical protein
MDFVDNERGKFPPACSLALLSPWSAAIGSRASLPDTPSPRSSAPKTPDAGAEPRKFLHYNYISEYEKKYKSKSLLSTMLN